MLLFGFYAAEQGYTFKSTEKSRKKFNTILQNVQHCLEFYNVILINHLFFPVFVGVLNSSLQ